MAVHSEAQVTLLAVGTMDSSSAGAWTDLSGLRYNLENGAPASLLGGLGSGLAYASDNTFLALPDRGPNAIPFNSTIDDTVSYINRFHTVKMTLTPNTSGLGLPMTLTADLRATTLLYNFLLPLQYGDGKAAGVYNGAPVVNTLLNHYFTGRSDNFSSLLDKNSSNPFEARFDSESIRVSNDGLSVFISDEYGPYIYEFSRLTGARIRSFTLPDKYYVPNQSSMGAVEISGNTTGRTANKGMEGLAITPDGKTLVGIMQNSLIQDALLGGDAAKMLRLVTIDIASGKVTHEYAYKLTDGSGVSEIVALNNHEFLVDERDGKGRGDGSKAKWKELFKIDLSGAVDVSDMDGTTAAMNAVPKTLFLNIVSALTGAGYMTDQIPAKIEGVAFGADVTNQGVTYHTLWVANDNDFLNTVQDDNMQTVANPNQFFVFGFQDSDLGGSTFVPQQFKGLFTLF